MSVVRGSGIALGEALVVLSVVVRISSAADGNQVKSAFVTVVIFVYQLVSDVFQTCSRSFFPACPVVRI